ncbi:MAG: hypothetical protein ACLP1X_32030 [Polyangiaceae bacterium]|jgi:hypothetical protein
MPFSRTPHRSHIIAAAVLVGATVLASGGDARADNVASTPKGTVGGALLGAEVVTITESLFGARPGWAYAVGAIVGAGGGGAAGYVVDQGSTDGKVPMYLLAGGLALIIPAIVLTLNATRYMPEEGATEDSVPTGPPAEPGVPSGTLGGPTSPPSAAPPPPVTSPAPAPPQSLLDVGGGAIRLGVPVPDVRPVFSMTEQRQYGMHAETEVRMPVLHLVF